MHSPCAFMVVPHRQCGGCKIFLCHLPSSPPSFLLLSSAPPQRQIVDRCLYIKFYKKNKKSYVNRKTRISMVSFFNVEFPYFTLWDPFKGCLVPKISTQVEGLGYFWRQKRILFELWQLNMSVVGSCISLSHSLSLSLYIYIYIYIYIHTSKHLSLPATPLGTGRDGTGGTGRDGTGRAGRDGTGRDLLASQPPEASYAFFL